MSTKHTGRRDEATALQSAKQKTPAKCKEWHRRYLAFINGGWMARLNKMEICVYLCYLSHADNETFEAFPGPESIAKSVGNKSRNHVFEARRNLEHHGLLTCLKPGVRGNGGGLAALYRVESAPPIDANCRAGATVSDIVPDNSNGPYSGPNESSNGPKSGPLNSPQTTPQMVPKEASNGPENGPQIVPIRDAQLLRELHIELHKELPSENQEESLTEFIEDNDAEVASYGIAGLDAKAIARKPGVYPVMLRYAYMKLAGIRGGKEDFILSFKDALPAWSPLRIGQLIDAGHVSEVCGHSLVGATVTRNPEGIHIDDSNGNRETIRYECVSPDSIVLTEPGNLSPLKDEKDWT